MNEEAQRIVIAEACGWKENGLGPKGTLHDPKGCTCFSGTGCRMPDYLHDLNAMNEAEKVLTNGQWLIYEHALQTPSALRGDYSHRHIIHATASQRAEAFLRTIGKWVEQEQVANA